MPLKQKVKKENIPNCGCKKRNCDCNLVLFKETLDNVEDLVQTVNLDGELIYVNKTWRKALGYSDSEIQKMTYRDIVRIDQLIKFEKVVNKVIKTKKPNNIRTVFKSKDGSIIPVEGSIVAVKQNKKITRIVGAFREITKKRLMEIESFKSESKYKKIFDHSPELIVLMDQKANILDVNRRSYDWFGFHENELIGKNLLELPMISKKDISALQKNFLRRISGKEVPPYEVTFESRSGKKIIGKITGVAIKSSKEGMLQDLIMVSDVTQRVQAQNELIKEKEKAQTYFDVAGSIMLVLNAQQEVEIINKKGCEVLGYNKNEIIGKNWFKYFLPPEDYKVTCDVFHQIIVGKVKNYEYFENYVIAKNKKRRLIAWHNTLLKDNSGKTSGILSSGADITAEREIHEELRRSEERFIDISESTNEWIWETDKDCLFKYSNHAISTILGLDPKALIGKMKLDEIFNFESVGKNECVNKLKQGETLTNILSKNINKKGETVWFLINAKPIYDKSNNKISGFRGSGINITYLKETEESLKSTKEEEENIYRVIPSGVMVLDHEGIIKNWNEKAEEITGYKADEIIGKSRFMFKEEICNLNCKLEGGSQKCSKECVIHRKDGSRRIVLKNMSFLKDKEGKIIETIESFEDITDRKNIETSLEQRTGELEKLNNFMVGRELRMIELKKEIDKLNLELAKYQVKTND